ncbi:nucleotidyl transferase AbiEii/AbiGii toxin family protein [bacterium]|nr:nucleotidyl transferase AbiEii/AbiGii toxin family protein [bacterium]
MDKKLRQAQFDILKIFSRKPGSFALAGGTALEIYYLNHRFSRDLDFFSSRYNQREINTIADEIKKEYGTMPVLENELRISGQARVRFYTLKIKGTATPLKLDFVEDNQTTKPRIKRVNKVPVYDARQIYRMKITTVSGVQQTTDETGRYTTLGGRNESRDAVDLYYLSKKIQPLNTFLSDVSNVQQRGIVSWYRRFSRQEFKLAYLDLEVYDEKLDSREIIKHLEEEITTFVAGEVE